MLLLLLLPGQLIYVKTLLNENLIIQKVRLYLHRSGRSILICFCLGSLGLFLPALLQCELHLGLHLLVKIAIAEVMEGEVETDSPKRCLLFLRSMALSALGVHVSRRMVVVMICLVQRVASVRGQALREAAFQLIK